MPNDLNELVCFYKQAASSMVSSEINHLVEKPASTKGLLHLVNIGQRPFCCDRKSADSRAEGNFGRPTQVNNEAASVRILESNRMGSW